MEINLTGPQSRFLTSKNKFEAFIGGIGSGKTFVGSAYAFNKIQSEPYALGFIGANTYRQLHNSTLEALFNLLTDINCPFEYNQNKGWLNINKARILCGSLENYNVYRGIEIGWFWIDEGRDTKEDAWRVMIGRLRDKKAKRLEGRVTSTPDGYNWMFDYFDGPKKTDEYGVVFASSYDNPHLPPGYLESLASNYDKKVYEQEVLGKFVNITSGQIYYSFDRTCVKPVSRNISFPLMIGMDFNVNPMTAVIGQAINNELTIIDEIWLQSSDTRQMAREIAQKYGRGHSIIPDSTGKRLQTSSAGWSDHEILRDEGFVVVSSKNPFRLDRYNTVNNLLEKKRLTIDPRCKHLINDLEKVSYKEGTNVPDDSRDPSLTHVSDALGYLAWHCYPILKPQSAIGMVNR